MVRSCGLSLGPLWEERINDFSGYFSAYHALRKFVALLRTRSRRANSGRPFVNPRCLLSWIATSWQASAFFGLEKPSV